MPCFLLNLWARLVLATNNPLGPLNVEDKGRHAVGTDPAEIPKERDVLWTKGSSGVLRNDAGATQ